MGKGGILGQLVTWVAINEVRAVHAVQERDEEARPLTAAEENRRREAAGERAKKIFGTVAALCALFAVCQWVAAPAVEDQHVTYVHATFQTADCSGGADPKTQLLRQRK